MGKMTSRERIMAASRQQPVDMIPLSPRLGYAVTIATPSGVHADVVVPVAKAGKHIHFKEDIC